MFNVRLSEAGFAEIDRIVQRDGLPDRGAATRRLLAYACRHMPAGWNGKELS